MSLTPLLLALSLAADGGSTAASEAAMQRIDAQPTMAVGDGTVRGDRLQPYDNAWRVTLRKKDGTTLDAGIWTETLRTRTLNGRQLLWWTSSGVYYQGGRSGDLSRMGVVSSLNIVDAGTLAPVRSMHHVSGRDVLNLSFDGTHVEQRTSKTDEGPQEATRFDTPSPVYDMEGGFWALIVPALDLHAGYSGVMPGLMISQGDKPTSVKGYPFRVVRRETIPAGYYGLVDTWVVELYEPGTKELFTFWVADKAPYVMRFTVPGDDYDQSFDALGSTAPIDWNFNR